MTDKPYSDAVRIDRIGAGLERHLAPDDASRARIAKALDLASLDSMTADLMLKPDDAGWHLTGKVRARAVQTCGLTLQPLPVDIDSAIDLRIVEAAPQWEEGEEIDIAGTDSMPDEPEDGRIDLGAYAVEQLSLALDPYPRAEGAEFVQPPEPVEISPFAALARLKTGEGSEQG